MRRQRRAAESLRPCRVTQSREGSSRDIGPLVDGSSKPKAPGGVVATERSRQARVSSSATREISPERGPSVDEIQREEGPPNEVVGDCDDECLRGPNAHNDQIDQTDWSKDLSRETYRGDHPALLRHPRDLQI